MTRTCSVRRFVQSTYKKFSSNTRPVEAFLPFQLEDAYSSAFVLYLVRTISPTLVPDDNWEENIQSVLEKMISKGSVVAPMRRMELSQLEHFMAAFSSAQQAVVAEDPMTMSEPGNTHEDTQDISTPLTPAAVDEPGWDLFQTDAMIGISPGEMLDLAAQLELNNPGMSVMH